jgi:hypothetical protein
MWKGIEFLAGGRGNTVVYFARNNEIDWLGNYTAGWAKRARWAMAPLRTFCPHPHLSAIEATDGVIGRPACRSLVNVGAALQADGGTRSAFAASSIRRRSAAWTILPD